MADVSGELRYQDKVVLVVGSTGGGGRRWINHGVKSPRKRRG